MDCPCEEQLIRMKLSDCSAIRSLHFDIPNRTLTVFHTESPECIHDLLNELNFDTSLLQTQEETDSIQSSEMQTPGSERKLLCQVLAINFAFFLIEVFMGLIAHSMSLMADGLDMLADSLVYGMALYAVGSHAARKRRVARWAGMLQLLLAFLGLAEVIHRFIRLDMMPHFGSMILISLFSLMGNAISLFLLQRSRSREAHMRAGMIFTSNDVIVNLGVIAAGVLVHFTQSAIPDLMVGIVIFILVAFGAWRIFRLR